MSGGQLLLAIGLVRQARPAGFCPACRLLMKALDARQELAKPTVAASVVLAMAGVAWAAASDRSRTISASTRRRFWRPSSRLSGSASLSRRADVCR